VATHNRPLSVRLDEEALVALDVVADGRLTRSEAIRTALLEAARERRRTGGDLDAEIRELAADEADRAEKAEVAEFMESLGGTW
jgi:metal-responsive CopG/Arc/MetJ family transcriptional regulator